MDTKYWNKHTLYYYVDALRQQLVGFKELPPIDSKGLARRCIKNLTLEQIPFPSNNICGILYKGDNSTSIGLNANRSLEMQNFDCMHELMHYFLHDVCYCSFVCCDGPNQSSKIKQNRIQEWQANEGAAQFLVPYQDFIPRFTDLLNANAIGIQRILAAHYHVTTQVINIRMDSLAYEIDQYRAGTHLDCLELLSRTQRMHRGITPTCYQALCDFALNWDSVIGF